jgi:hypothetical protein
MACEKSPNPSASGGPQHLRYSIRDLSPIRDLADDADLHVINHQGGILRTYKLFQ